MLGEFLKNVWYSATFGIARIQEIPLSQIFAALLIQVCFFLLAPENTKIVFGCASVVVYVFSVGLSMHRPFSSSIVSPVALGMTLIGPVCASLPAILGMRTFVGGLLTPALVVSYPFFFFAIDSYVIARAHLEATQKKAPQYRDSFFTKDDSRLPSQEVLNALNSVAEMDESMLRLLRGARPLELGEVVGTYRNQQIHSWIKTVDGSFYDYDQALPIGAKYGFPANGTLVLPPGLIYLKRDA